MESIDYTRLGLGLGVILILLGAFYWAMKHFAGNMRVGKWRSGQRIGVVDMAPVDGTRRLVLVRRDNVEHLLLLGDDGDLVVESGIPLAKPAEPEAGKGPAAGGTWPSLPSLRMPGKDTSGKDGA
ncbi:flagellar biosynthetic protein FliO [Ferrovibrio sp.]|uniref:flagellar biosynthetic protein FliO n=1 Tax=Ferrovibrio sp. TaxID=1917215 RepID=UPI001B4180DE|nr:flagellar biosynthetic protein FliO [Ferrovibrio sp.]MBP7063720.1 flagellar biosynthetic protein FliO [Ferrovibrio sp.]